MDVVHPPNSQTDVASRQDGGPGHTSRELVEAKGIDRGCGQVTMKFLQEEKTERESEPDSLSCGTAMTRSEMLWRRSSEDLEARAHSLEVDSTVLSDKLGGEVAASVHGEAATPQHSESQLTHRVLKAPSTTSGWSAPCKPSLRAMLPAVRSIFEGTGSGSTKGVKLRR